MKNLAFGPVIVGTRSTVPAAAPGDDPPAAVAACPWIGIQSATRTAIRSAAPTGHVNLARKPISLPRESGIPHWTSPCPSEHNRAIRVKPGGIGIALVGAAAVGSGGGSPAQP